MIFPSNEEFIESQKSDIIKWRDVPIDIIYQIENVEQMITQNGEAMIVSLINKEGKK